MSLDWLIDQSTALQAHQRAPAGRVVDNLKWHERDPDDLPEGAFRPGHYKLTRYGTREGSIADRMMRALDEHGDWMTVKQLLEAVGGSRSDKVSMFLRSCMDRGSVECRQPTRANRYEYRINRTWLDAQEALWK